MKTLKTVEFQGVHGDVQERAVVQEPIRTEDNLSPKGDGFLHVITKVRSQRTDHHHARIDGRELTGCNVLNVTPRGTEFVGDLHNLRLVCDFAHMHNIGVVVHIRQESRGWLPPATTQDPRDFVSTETPRASVER